MKVYRGAAAAARAYVEADRSRADDYYLAEGTGLATRYVATPDTVGQVGVLDGPDYERWVAGYRVETGEPKGRLRVDGHGVRFVEVVVNGPKTWSLAASLHPDVATVYDAAQDRAAEQIIGWLAQHATTRVGPRGRQVQVPVQELEAVVVRHYTSRAGDPHRHLHLQVNARVFAADRWRGLHTVGVRDSLEAINGIGHAAVLTDPGFRATLAGHGLEVDPVSGEIVQLAPFVGGFSARAAQIGRNVETIEAQWRAANPGTEPGPRLRQAWDRRAWAQARPDKVLPTDGADLVARWNQTLHDLGYHEPAQPALPILTGVTSLTGPSVGSLDRDAIVARVLSRLGAKRSAWNAADIRGEVEHQVAATGLVVDAGVRLELAEDLTARAVTTCTRLVTGDVPEHVRSLTSPEVLAVEAEILTRLAARTTLPCSRTPTLTARLTVSAGQDEHDLDVAQGVAQGLARDVAVDVGQGEAVGVLAGDAALVVVEGAAGAGKTTTLTAAKTSLAEQGHRLVMVTPTLKAAQVAASEVGSDAFSAAWLAVQHGWRWDDDGVWSREPSTTPDPAAVLGRGDLLVVDEAGMLDQDTARALLTVADEAGARVALVGDRHQLPAVGRGGVLDLAAVWARPETRVELDVVHRFTDPAYADLSLAMRTGREPGAVFDTLLARGLIVLHASEAERTHALAERAVAAILAGHDNDKNTWGGLVLADGRDQVTALNGAIRDRLVAAGHVDDTQSVATDAGERLGVGDRVATRRNDRDLGVANRQTWTITGVGSDGTLELVGSGGETRGQIRRVPAGYVREHVELAYAVTVYGAQGQTTTAADFVLADHTSAASAYVAMTRGRESNTAHVVADSVEEARAAWELVFGRDRADLGPAHARQLALDDIDRYGTQPHSQPVPAQPSGRRLEDVLADLQAVWAEQADLADRHQHLTDARGCLKQVVTIRARYEPRLTQLRHQQQAAHDRWREAHAHADALEDTIARQRAELRDDLTSAWQANLPPLREAAATIRAGSGVLGQRHHQVRDARDTLTTWAEQWRTVLPDLPHDPDQLTDAFTAGQLWLTSPAVRAAFDAHIDRQINRAHPDAEQIRDHASAADGQAVQAENNRRALEDHVSGLLRPFGRYGLLAHPDDVLAKARQDLTRAEDQRRAIDARIGGLTAEPAILALPAGDLDTLHHAWQTQRMHEQQARASERIQASQQAERACLARATHLDQRRSSPGHDIGGIGR